MLRVSVDAADEGVLLGPAAPLADTVRCARVEERQVLSVPEFGPSALSLVVAWRNVQASPFLQRPWSQKLHVRVR